ncbi:hypothetical protein AAMO2058_001402900 [Amorphochlora amoebiformis]
MTRISCLPMGSRIRIFAIFGLFWVVLLYWNVLPRRVEPYRLRGVKGLGKMLQNIAPNAISQMELKSYSGRSVAIDGNMALYQFLIAIRTRDGYGGRSESLKNDMGDTTSHLLGLFSRTIALLKAGIQMVYVFDGVPNALKRDTLISRYNRRNQATQKLNDLESVALAVRLNARLIQLKNQLETARESGEGLAESQDTLSEIMFAHQYNPLNTSAEEILDGINSTELIRISELFEHSTEQPQMKDERDLGQEQVKADSQEAEKLQKRTVKVTRQHVNESITLLRLMGIPVVKAPGEAEAQCACLARQGIVYAAATEDLDALIAGAPRVLRGLASPKGGGGGGEGGGGDQVTEIALSRVLEGGNLTSIQLADIAAILGSDFSDGIHGVGPTAALRAIRRHGSLDKYLSTLPPPEFLKYPFDFKRILKARDLLHKPEVRDYDENEIDWRD